MVLQSDIERAFWDQQQWVKLPSDVLARSFLKGFKPSGGQIEVLTGIRRCGKSTVMRQLIRKHFRKVAFFNFEDSRIYGFEVRDFQKLDAVMPAASEAYFFDEIQNVESWELYIRQLHDRGVKIFITGSNASLLSRELGTRLTGRHLRHEVFPFSYPEFLKYRKLKKSGESLNQYLLQGGFPEYLRSGNPEVLQMLMKDIVLRDIAVRHGIRNTQSLMNITLYLLSNIGKECTFNRLKNSFELGSANTASDYLHWLEDSYLLYFLPRFSYSARKTQVNPRKVYAVDNGMITANTLSYTEDQGRLLENAVYLHLRRQAYTLYYFQEKKECDFVVFDHKQCRYLLQVCMEVNSDTLHRETCGLLEAMAYFKLSEGYIITVNQADTLELEGRKIHLVPAHVLLSGGVGI